MKEQHNCVNLFLAHYNDLNLIMRGDKTQSLPKTLTSLCCCVHTCRSFNRDVLKVNRELGGQMERERQTDLVQVSAVEQLPG